AMTDAPLYEYALKKAGIPYFSVSSRGFYQQAEVRDMMSLLSFLENPFSDISLAAVLRSPLFQITDDTLYWLARSAKSEDDTYPLYRGVLEFETLPQISNEERKKLVFFRETAAELMREKDKLRLTELLDLILERTGYELALAAGPESVRRLANLKKLASMARREEANGPLAAGDFLKRVKQLELQEVRESEAQIESEASGKVVRLMTIHKSKGLEFRAVFVADMGRGSRNSSTSKIMARTGMGASLQVWNESARKWEEPLTWQKVRDAQNRKEKEERKRLLYVAMTRTQEKLFLCGVVDGERETEEKSFYELASWMDWLAVSEDAVGAIDRLQPVLTEQAGDSGILANWEDVWRKVSGREELEKEASSEELRVRERLKPRPRVQSRAVDLPVSAFALFNVSSEAYGRVYEAGVPEVWEDSAQRQEMTQDVQADAADFGTAMHALFERLDFKNPQARLEELLTDCFSGLPPACRPEAEKLLGLFMKTELFGRLQKARRIERELPFVLRERHGMIQGVIDVLFEDEKGWHILDYKTAVGDESKVKSRGYAYQIEIYAAACRRLMGKDPQSGILYFLKNQWQYVASFDKTSLDRAALELRKVQEDILNYKNSLYS
ncbi:MAG: PD-(D/E)XK nuclease family protein, partial [Candidatus Omnitrophica bacterium]|nr:PD-(D/E)XK nuclease family protein [Candidatus Omnitrophota bacterium]